MYLSRSDANDTLENGRLVTEVALGNASLSEAGASGFIESRSKSSGLNTLRKYYFTSAHDFFDGLQVVNIPIDDVCDAIVQNVIGKCDLCVVHKYRAVRKDSESQIAALK